MASLSGNGSCASQVGVSCCKWQVLQLSWVRPYCTDSLLLALAAWFCGQNVTIFAVVEMLTSFCGEQ